MATKVENVPQSKITSVDVLGFSGGFFSEGQWEGKGNQIVEGSNVEITKNGAITERRSLEPWLPETVEAGHHIKSVETSTGLVHFTADDGKVKYIPDGAEAWIDCGGDNTITTNNGGKTILLEVLNVLLILNGGNGDKLCYVDIETKEVVKYVFVADPTTALTASPTGITNSGSYVIYYSWTFSSAVGETELAPILTYTISKPRSQWASATEYLTLQRPAGSPPTGAKKWNLYMAIASAGGTIQNSDMLRLATGLDLATFSFVDDGTIPVDLTSGVAPSSNSTDGPRVKYGIETEGRPILYGDVDDEDNIWIGGDGDFALDFSSSNGGFRSQPSKGTSFKPAVIKGFRNNQGIPSLTILFSSPDGLSKQATLEQQTVNYGNYSFIVWGVTEQHYGAAGVASPLGAVSYLGQLVFPSFDGFTSMDTLPQIQSVISSRRIDKDIEDYVSRIKVEAYPEIVGTAWGGQNLWIVPAEGFDTPTDILIRDLNLDGAWLPPLKIPAQWIGTVAPPNSAAFVYIRQGTKILKLVRRFGTIDFKGGAGETFSSYARGAFVPVNEARNAYQACVQAVFNLIDYFGQIEAGVRYRDKDDTIQEVSDIFNGPEYTPSSSGSWSDPQFLWSAGGPLVPGWSAPIQIDEQTSSFTKKTAREVVRIGDLASEFQWWVRTVSPYSGFKLRSVVYEGESIGISADIR